MSVYFVPEWARTSWDYDIPDNCDQLIYRGKYLSSIDYIPSSVTQIDFRHTNIRSMPLVGNNVKWIDLEDSCMNMPLEFHRGAIITSIDCRILDCGEKLYLKGLPSSLISVGLNDNVIMEEIPDNLQYIVYNGNNSEFMVMLKLYGFTPVDYPTTWVRHVS